MVVVEDFDALNCVRYFGFLLPRSIIYPFIVPFDLNQNRVIEFNEFYEFMRFIISEKGYEL